MLTRMRTQALSRQPPADRELTRLTFDFQTASREAAGGVSPIARNLMEGGQHYY